MEMIDLLPRVTATRATALSAMPSPGLLGLVGDSRAATYSLSGVTLSKPASGLPTWFEFFSHGRFRLHQDYDKAVGGSTVADAVGQMASLVAVSPRCSHVLILTGTNTFNGSGTATDAWTSMQAVIARALSAGIVPIVVLDLPRQQSTFSPGSSAAFHSMRFNELVRRGVDSIGYTVIDLTPTLADPASATGDPLSGYYADGIHLAHKGAVLAGKEAAAYFTDPGKPYRGFSSAKDIYDATYNTSGNLIGYGLMQGTSGTSTGTGASGTVPTSWKNSINGGTGTSVSSIVARTDGGAGSWWQTVITGSDGLDIRLIPGTDPTTGFATGDKIVLEADIEVESATTMFKIAAGLTAYGTGLVVKGRGEIAAPTSGQNWPDGSYTGRFICPPATVTSDTIQLRPQFNFVCATGGGSATIRIGAVSLRKV
jgi:hypothetical protein